MFSRHPSNQNKPSSIPQHHYNGHALWPFVVDFFLVSSNLYEHNEHGRPRYHNQKGHSSSSLAETKEHGIWNKSYISTVIYPHPHHSISTNIYQQKHVASKSYNTSPAQSHNSHPQKRYTKHIQIHTFASSLCARKTALRAVFFALSVSTCNIRSL